MLTESIEKLNREVLSAHAHGVAQESVADRRRDEAASRMAIAGYESLASVLHSAYLQAAVGKGRDRHATSLPFDQQPMQSITTMVGHGFPLGQAIKKVQEAQRMDPDAAERELLGAIVYIAGAIVALRRSCAGGAA